MPRLILALIFSAIYALPAYAAPTLASARSEARTLAAKKKKFALTVSQLSTANRIKLKSLLAKSGTDADNDGVSDDYESAVGSNLCNSDSDSDGVPDNRDNNEDAPEVEAQGEVVSFDGTTLVVGSTTFTVNDSTVLRPSSLTITAGICVEVKGHADGATNIADRVKQEDCPGGGD
jgi:hypothetical protein